MRYFTKELLMKINGEDESVRTQAEEAWKRNDADYNQQFAKIQKHLPRRFLKNYFSRRGFHDYTICGINIFRKKKSYSCELELSDGMQTVLLLMEGIVALNVNLESIRSCIQGDIWWAYSEFEITADKNIKLSVLCDPLNELQFEFKTIKFIG